MNPECVNPDSLAGTVQVQENSWARRPSHRNPGQNTHVTSNFEQFLDSLAPKRNAGNPKSNIPHAFRPRQPSVGGVGIGRLAIACCLGDA